ncbi:MAG: flagellar hook-associated protein FlgK [Magnetospirillum sp.]|nr:flagellar hook-associated protein FlgK [Magnetospirillum sp.]
MSLTLGLNTALSGLMTSQRGLDVISQNVVNVNTKGYTRKVMTPESRVLSGTGAGVQVGSVNRMVNEGLLKDIRRQSTITGKLEVEQSYYPRIDDLFGDVADNTSIAHKLADLTNAFESLGTEVNKPAIQWSAVQSAQDVTDLLDRMTSSLQSLRIEADRDIENTVTDINNLLNNIHDLNQKIVKNAAVATGTSDLEDKRDQALTDLAKLVDIQYYKRTDGSVTIFSNSGQMLLDNQPQLLSYSATSTTDAWMTAAGGQFSKITVAGGSQDFGPEVTGGKLRGLLDMRDTALPNLQANLDEMTKQMTEAINQAHNRGTSLPNVSSRYQGTRVFAKQGDIVPAAGETNATIYKGSTTIASGAGGYGSLSFAPNAANPWQYTLTATNPAFNPTNFGVGQTFSISGAGTPGAPEARNDGTYRVVGYTSTNQIVVEKVNVRQTMQLQGGDDVVLATFDQSGNQLKQTTLNEIMQLDFTVPPYSPAPPYSASTAGNGRTLADFQGKGDHDQWGINEVSAHVEAWLRSQGYNNASVNLDNDGKMVVDVGDSTVSLAFRDQSSSTPGGAATDATISFDVNGDGAVDETVKGFSNFFGLNDLYVNSSPASIQDSAVQPSTFTLTGNRDLSLYDTSGKLGNTISLPKGASLQQIADAINKQTQTNESAALSSTSWSLGTAATITVADGSGSLFTLNLGPGNHTLEEIAGKLTQGSVTAQVVQDGGASRLRLSDSRGEALSVTITGGTITGSTMDLNQTLEMKQTQRIEAAVVPEGSGYRLRIRQTTGDTLYSSSTLDALGKNLLSDLGLERAATGSAGSTSVRSDIMTAPEKISRGSVQWNADTNRYYISEGDNTIAQAMSDVMTQKSSMDTAGSIYAGKYNFAEYASATVGVVAQASSASQSQMDYQTTLNASLDFQNASFSGVNLDEEISAMMDFQQAYSASAKVISTLQDMLETLTSMIR